VPVPNFLHKEIDMRHQSVIASIGFIVAVLVPLAAAGETSIVRCESPRYEYVECRIALPGQGTVAVQRELGRAPCVYKQTWGVRGKTIWVTGGCRALFRFTPDAPPAERFGRTGFEPSFTSPLLGKTIRCESSGGARKLCPANTLGGVRMIEQLSILPCTRGESWGYTSTGIWVDAGCRADFKVAYSAAAPVRPTVTCESPYGETVSCPANTRNGVTLTRRLSKTDCIRNETWGYDQWRIWVSDGCRAQFALGH
jgi:hypothetical protein